VGSQEEVASDGGEVDTRRRRSEGLRARRLLSGATLGYYDMEKKEHEQIPI
jgi:hypothetical protein